MIIKSKDFVRIPNENEQAKLAKYAAYNSNSLCRKILVLENGNFTQNDIDKLKCNLPHNLLTIQFRKLEQSELFTFNSAANLIRFQNNVVNKILVVPKYISFEEFIQLDSMLTEQYTLTLFHNMDERVMVKIMEFAEETKKIVNVEIFSSRNKAGIEKIAMIGKRYSHKFKMGVINIWANEGKAYSNSAPEIFFSNYGYISFSKEIMFNGRKPNRFTKFNLNTCKYDMITETQMINQYGTYASVKLFCENFQKINQKLKYFETKSTSEISKELISNGLEFSIK